MHLRKGPLLANEILDLRAALGVGVHFQDVQLQPETHNRKETAVSNGIHATRSGDETHRSSCSKSGVSVRRVTSLARLTCIAIIVCEAQNKLACETFKLEPRQVTLVLTSVGISFTNWCSSFRSSSCHSQTNQRRSGQPREQGAGEMAESNLDVFSGHEFRLDLLHQMLHVRQYLHHATTTTSTSGKGKATFV